MDESCLLYVLFKPQRKRFSPNTEKLVWDWSSSDIICDVLEVFWITAGNYDMNTYQQCFMHNQYKV